ncbi:MAG: cytochrome P450 [Gammaproteobacteria bacterium]|nr:cytochrome P450 [Gammaproteobacteria bacterium]
MPADYRFDPADPDLIRNPYPYYAAMRAAPGLHRAAGPYWVASRHADVRDVLASPKFGQGDFTRNIQLFYGPDFYPLQHSCYRWLSEVLLMQDPPAHTRLRRLVISALTPKRISDMRPRIEAITAELLDSVMPKGKMEVLSEFAYLLPTLLMCDMLGVDEVERTPTAITKLTRAIADGFLVFETRPLTAQDLALENEQMDYLYDYFGALYAQRAQAPGDDLTSALSLAREEDGSSLAMFGAGFETTAHMIGDGLLCMHQSPSEWQLLVSDPDTYAPPAAEEVLRIESSLQGSYRTALQDAEVAGTKVAAGEKVLCVLGSANHDPAEFSDPDRMDISERDSRIMSFGGGIHHCIGQRLARLEGRIAFTALARRLPGMQVDTTAPRWRPGFLFRGLQELQANW